MTHVRVLPCVRHRYEVTRAAEDSSPVDHVVDTWMREHGVQEGDFVQAFSTDIHGMDSAVTVWVVVTRSGLVLCVAEPPVGHPLPTRPTAIDRGSQAPAVRN